MSEQAELRVDGSTTRLGGGAAEPPALTLAGRYRLVERVGGNAVVSRWRGEDEALARPVAVSILDEPAAVGSGRDDGERRFLATAGLVGRVVHPGIASTYDADAQRGQAYVVSEWVDGEPLAAVLRSGPLPPRRAAAVVLGAADALAAAHRRGVHHEALRTATVLLSRAAPGGETAAVDVHVTGLGLDALAGEGPPAVFAALAPDVIDARLLGALLYAALTGRSPYGVDPALPPAPGRDSPPPARQLAAAVPRDLDEVASRALDLPRRRGGGSSLDTAAEVAAALEPLLADHPSAWRDPASLLRRRARLTRRVARFVVPLVVVALLGLAVFGYGKRLGTRAPTPGASPLPALAGGAPGTGDGSAGGQSGNKVRLSLGAVRAFDPPPGDGGEQDGSVPLAYDPAASTEPGDVSTSWSTDIYQGSAAFGGLKPGVGLLVDLGSPQGVASVDVTFTSAGTTAEVRAVTPPDGQPPTQLAALPVVSPTVTAGQTQRFPVAAGTSARYYLLWITGLPSIGSGRYQASVADISLTR